MQQHVHIDQDTQGHATRLGLPSQRAHRVRVVSGDGDLRAAREICHTGQLAFVHHLIGDHHVVDACGDHRLGLANRRARHAARGPAKLALRELGRAMRLDVGPQGLAAVSEHRLHSRHIGLEDVEVDDQRRCRDVLGHLRRSFRYCAPRAQSGSKRLDTWISCSTADDTDG